MASGKVKWFNQQKGYGFIEPDEGGKDVFVHITAVEDSGMDGLKEAQAVQYDLGTNNGKTMAVNISEVG